MTPVRARIALAALMALVAAVAINAMFLQQEFSADAVRRKADARRFHAILLQKEPAADAARREIKTKRTAQAEIAQIDTERPSTVTRSSAANERAQSVDASLRPSVSIRLSKSQADRQVVFGVQRELNNLGYKPGPVDGIAGMMTRAAILAFEHDERMSLSGEPSDMLLKRLVFGAPGRRQKDAPSVPASEDARQIIIGVQESLIRLGYGLKGSSGRLDEATQQAIRAFEREYNLAPSGRISGRLIMRLTRSKSSGHDLAAKWR